MSCKFPLLKGTLLASSPVYKRSCLACAEPLSLLGSDRHLENRARALPLLSTQPCSPPLSTEVIRSSLGSIYSQTDSDFHNTTKTEGLKMYSGNTLFVFPLFIQKRRRWLLEVTTLSSWSSTVHHPQTFIRCPPGTRISPLLDSEDSSSASHFLQAYPDFFLPFQQ